MACFGIKAGLFSLLVGGLLSFLLFYFNVLNTLFGLSKIPSAFLFGIFVTIGAFLALILGKVIFDRCTRKNINTATNPINSPALCRVDDPQNIVPVYYSREELHTNYEVSITDENFEKVKLLSSANESIENYNDIEVVWINGKIHFLKSNSYEVHSFDKPDKIVIKDLTVNKTDKITHWHENSSLYYAKDSLQRDNNSIQDCILKTHKADGSINYKRVNYNTQTKEITSALPGKFSFMNCLPFFLGCRKAG